MYVQALFWDPRRLRRRLRDWEWYRQLVGGQPGATNDSKSAKGGDKPGLGLKSAGEGDKSTNAGEGDKSAGPLGRVATLWLQPLLVSVVENTWDPLSVEQTRALVEVRGLCVVYCVCVYMYVCICICVCVCTRVYVYV